jgi:hypothetical protein
MKMLKKILCAVLSNMLVLSVGIIGASAEGGDYVIVSPYKDVVWEGDKAWGAYKGTLHSHTTYSDASEPLSVMIKEYYNQDYDFVATADHGVTGVDWDKAPSFPPLYLYQPIIGCKFEHLTTEEYTAIQNGTYPLYDGVTIRNKKMVPVLGANELNFIALSKNHINGYFLDGATGMGFQSFEGIAGYEDAVAFVDANGGLSHINHPGDWLNSNANPQVVNDPEMVKQFGDIILKYDSCLGTEVFNEKNGTTGYDRILWDNLLMYTLPYGKNVIGFSNTDAHTKSMVNSSFSVFMMEENNVENIKETMQNGNFFMVTRNLRKNVVNEIGPDEAFDVIDEIGLSYPMFTKVSVDGHKITVAAKDADKLQFIANGKVIAKYDVGEDEITLDLDTIDGAEDFLYVRAELLGEGGMTLTQALTIDDGSEPLEFVEKTGVDALLDKILQILSSLRLVVIVQEIIRAF